MKNKKRKKTKKLGPQDRQCGACQQCCYTLPVQMLGKPVYARCEHQCETGCSIYETRPDDCRIFMCSWLEGRLPSQLRPDRCGYVFETQRYGNIRVLMGVPAEPPAVDMSPEDEVELLKAKKIMDLLVDTAFDSKHLVIFFPCSSLLIASDEETGRRFHKLHQHVQTHGTHMKFGDGTVQWIPPASPLGDAPPPRFVRW